jgi:ubiquinone/menaquinone biosynthesis C-methylase UbiE
MIANHVDMQHKMWSITLDGKLHLAPIDPNPQNVLDVATGTGIWAVEFGTKPFSQIYIKYLLWQPTFTPQLE